MREVRLAVAGHPGVVQVRDVRMSERREDAAFPGHALGETGALPGAVGQLQRDRSIDEAIGALRQPHDTHAAAADLAHQPIEPDLLTRLFDTRGSGREITRLELELGQRVQKLAGFDHAGA